MRKQFLIMTLYVSTFIILCEHSYGWGNIKTHPSLTEKALEVDNTIDNYLKNQLSLNSGLSTELYWDFPEDIKGRIKWGEAEPEKTTRSILEWLQVGSTIEDEDGRRWPIRSRHHFHDPYRNAGLDNQSDHPNWQTYLPAFGTFWDFDFTGASALHWAAVGTAEKEPTTNDHYWGKAREEFYNTLTESDESVREKSLAKTFLNLGHVLHLIEDAGVPAHARNDFIEAHYRGIKSPLNFKGNPLEKHVENEIGTSGIPTRWLSGWSPNAKVFSKLSDYWDIDDYNGQYVGSTPDSDWGLSERTNYQFLSRSTIFKADDGTLYYFPHPHSSNVSGYIEPGVYSWNSIPVHYKYISGYNITHLARTKYVLKYANMAGIGYPTQALATVYHTTFDDAVYEDYAEVTIPRTIDYATGLLNYFFRGRLSVEPNWADPNIVELTITNDSNNSGVPQVLKGGDFELYWDDRDGNRAEVGDFTVEDWEPESVLNYGETLTATFTRQADAAAYTLVYTGQISQNPSAPDLDDPNAIAVAVFRPGYPIIAWGRDDYGQVSDVPEGNDFILL